VALSLGPLDTGQLKRTLGKQRRNPLSLPGAAQESIGYAYPDMPACKVSGVEQWGSELLQGAWRMNSNHSSGKPRAIRTRARGLKRLGICGNTIERYQRGLALQEAALIQWISWGILVVREVEGKGANPKGTRTSSRAPVTVSTEPWMTLTLLSELRQPTDPAGI